MDEATFEDPKRTILSKSSRKPKVPPEEARVRHKKDTGLRSHSVRFFT